MRIQLQRKRAYTVLLLYPDYVAQNYGEDSILVHVKARSPADAIREARASATRELRTEANPTDFFPLLTCVGHLEDLTPFGG